MVSFMCKAVLGVGFWLQGLRWCPWMVVAFFLKDGLSVDPSTLQLILTSAHLPIIGKPLYGIISDAFYIKGQHRIPYIAFGVLLEAFSWLAIAILSQWSISVFSITLLLLLSNLGASITEVANEALVTEIGKQPCLSSDESQSSSVTELQSFVSAAASVGGLIGNLLAGYAINRYHPQVPFLLFGSILALQFLVTITVRESSLQLPENSSDSGLRNQLSLLFVEVRKPEIAYPLVWLAASYAIIPVLTGTMFFYQTQYLKIEPSLLGISKLFGQAMILLWSVIYNYHLKSVPARKSIAVIQALMAVFVVSDVLFVKGIYRDLGLPDSIYVLLFSSFMEVLVFFKLLPFNILMAQLCSPGCEGSLMAIVASAIALAFTISGYIGVALASYAGITGDDFSGFPRALLIQAFCTALPIYWALYLPDDGKKPEIGTKFK